MAENYVLIDDIIKNHTERMLNLRKFYPFFSLAETTFSQYKEGRFRFLDMGYITLSVIRFFINENSFNDRPVTYGMYEDFCIQLLKRDFDIDSQFDVEKDQKDKEIRELVRYIFDKLRNYGRAFEFTFFDPADKKEKWARVRLIESVVKEDEVVYSVTEDAIEFYLSTKEVRDESRINMDQLLLEKMIRSENFSGSIDIIQRINIEVKALDKKREEVIKLLLTDVHAGTAAVDEYMDKTSVWFAEERKSFAKNRELLDKAVARLSYDTDFKTPEDISKLQTMLKQTIESHSQLIASTAELSRFSDEMVRRSRTRSLRNAFDFEGMLRTAIKEDEPEMLSLVFMPFLLPRREKSLSMSTIDNLVLTRTGESLKGEEKQELVADLNFRYEDELLSESVGNNFAKLFLELLGRLERWERVTLEEYMAILEVKFGKDIKKNRDLYSFITHLAGKEHYKVKEMLTNSETFLEDMVLKYSKDALEQYRDLQFDIEYDKEDRDIMSEEGDKIAELSDIVFVRKR